MDLGVGQDDTRLGHVLDGELGAATLSGQSADSPRQMVA